MSQLRETSTDAYGRRCHDDRHSDTYNHFVLNVASKLLLSHIEYTFATNGETYEPHLITKNWDNTKDYSHLPLKSKMIPNFLYTHGGKLYLGKAKTVCKGYYQCEEMNFPNTTSVTKITISFDYLNISKVAITDIIDDGSITFFNVTFSFKCHFTNWQQLENTADEQILVHDLYTITNKNVEIRDYRRKTEDYVIRSNSFRRFVINDPRNGEDKRTYVDFPINNTYEVEKLVPIDIGDEF